MDRPLTPRYGCAAHLTRGSRADDRKVSKIGDVVEVDTWAEVSMNFGLLEPNESRSAMPGVRPPRAMREIG